jgi:hypothetical protein
MSEVAAELTDDTDPPNPNSLATAEGIAIGLLLNAPFWALMVWWVVS